MALFTVVHELAAGLAMGNRRRNYGNWPAPTILEPDWTLTASTCRRLSSAGDQPQDCAEYDSVMGPGSEAPPSLVQPSRSGLLMSPPAARCHRMSHRVSDK